MKRWILYGVLLATVGLLKLLPFEGTDVGKLKPVELIRISESRQFVLVETDTDDWGIGENLTEAFRDLKETTSGVIFLETADHLIITEGTVDLLPELTTYLRPGCNVYLERGFTDVEKAAAFLSAHESPITLNDLRAEPRAIPVIVSQEERMYLVP